MGKPIAGPFALLNKNRGPDRKEERENVYWVSAPGYFIESSVSSFLFILISIVNNDLFLNLFYFIFLKILFTHF